MLKPIDEAIWEAEGREPVAYLIEWNIDRRRVQLSAELEPWLQEENPVVTPLYTSPPPASGYVGAEEQDLAAYGPYRVRWMGPGVWAGIPDEFPAELEGRDVWLSTAPPAPGYAEGLEAAARWHDAQAAHHSDIAESTAPKSLIESTSHSARATEHERHAAAIRKLKEGG